jgi:hypothetical protein
MIGLYETLRPPFPDDLQSLLAESVVPGLFVFVIRAG